MLYCFDEPPATKRCSKCQEDLPLANFGRSSGGNYLRPECRACGKKLDADRARLRKIAPPIPDDYHCPICLKSEAEARGKGGRNSGTWCLDHNHKTLEFRGYLCHSCNRTIGQLEEDPERLIRAMKYLNSGPERTKNEENP